MFPRTTIRRWYEPTPLPWRENSFRQHINMTSLVAKSFAPVTTRNGADILIDNTVIAVLFDWPLAGPFWLALRDDFISGDGLPVFFASELPHLRQMTPDELRRRYAEKKAIGASWIRDRKKSEYGGRH